MKRATQVGLATAVLAVSCSSMAGAQTNGPSGISVRVGAFLPTNSIASDLSHTWWTGGLDYKLNALSARTPVTNTEAYFGVSADYYGHGSNNDISVALTYNLRQGPVVFSAGIGPDFRNASDLKDTGVGLAEQVGVAYEFGPFPTPIFISAKYFFASKPELSGVGLYVGVRF